MSLLTIEAVRAGIINEEFHATIDGLDVSIGYIKTYKEDFADCFVCHPMGYLEERNFNGADALNRAVMFANKSIKKLNS